MLNFREGILLSTAGSALHLQHPGRYGGLYSSQALCALDDMVPDTLTVKRR